MTAKMAPIIIAIGVIAFIAVIGIFVVGSPVLKTIGGGGTVISLGEVSVGSAASELNTNEQVWLATVSIDNGGSYLSGYQIVKPSGTTTQTLDSGTGKKSSEPIRVDYSLDYQKCSYLVSSKTNSFVQKKIISAGTVRFSSVCNPLTYAAPVNVNGDYCAIPIDYGGVQCLGDYERACSGSGGLGGTMVTCGVGDIGRKCLKIVDDESQPILNLYNMQSPSTKWGTTITYTTSKGVDSVILSNSAHTAVSENRNIYARYVGGFETDAPRCDSESSGVVGFYPTRMRAYIYDPTKLSVVMSKVPSATSCQSYRYDCLDTLVNNYNTELNNFELNAQNFNFANAVINMNPEGTGSGINSVEIDKTASAVQNPVIATQIKASFLGIVTPIAKPEIANIWRDSESCTSGVADTIHVAVQNTGDNGGVDLSLVCPGGTVAPSTYPLSYSSGTIGEVKTRDFLATFNSGTTMCTATATSVGDPNIKSTKTISLTCEDVCKVSCTPPRTLDPESCACTCNENILSCQPDQEKDLVNCICVKKSGDNETKTCTNTQEKDNTVVNGTWIDYPTCAWRCPSGTSMTAERVCVQSGCPAGQIVQNGKCTTPIDPMLIALGIFVVVTIVGAMFLMKNKGKR